MKKDYTILFPNMLPMHFKIMSEVFRQYGYHCELLENDGRDVIECGLKYTHNDTCYPALLVIGQFINALQSGKYDLSKTAVIMTQTGGGCRASNYIALIRKALKKAGYKIEKIQPFDLFPFTTHVECVVCLTRIGVFIREV